VAGTGQSGYSGDGGLAVEAQIGSPTAVCLDTAGNLYFADNAYNVIRKVDTRGVITTVVGQGEAGFSPDGTLAQEAKIDTPWGMVVSVTGTVYFSDSRNGRVRCLTTEGKLETVAGSPIFGDAGDGGPASTASLNEPHGLCFYGHDILLISDHFNNRVRAVRVG
jgi:hypothetical protein